MDIGALQLLTEAVLRVVLGYRFLSSGWSNMRRWPHATETAAIISRRWAYPLGLAATAMMVAGGTGLILGLLTPIAALLLALFLLPTFVVHHHQLKELREHAEPLGTMLPTEAARGTFRTIARHAIHSHETGLLDNAVYLAACLFFAAHGSSGFSIDAWLQSR